MKTNNHKIVDYSEQLPFSLIFVSFHGYEHDENETHILDGGGSIRPVDTDGIRPVCRISGIPTLGETGGERLVLQSSAEQLPAYRRD